MKTITFAANIITEKYCLKKGILSLSASITNLINSFYTYKLKINS